MKAWKVTSEKTIELADLGAQAVSPSCVKIRMLTALVDTAEAAVYNGNASLPLIVGRNGVGMVTETGEEVTSFKRGDKVYIRPVSSCGVCSACKKGNRSACERAYTYGKTEDGVLRDFITVPQSDIIALPQQVNETQGVFIEDVALAVEALDKLGIEKGEHVVIVGASRIGLILAQAAIYYQAIPILIDIREDRLALAEKMGIYYTINAVSSDPVKKVFSITCGKMAETMMFSLGAGFPVKRSFEMLTSGGRAAFVGYDNIDCDLTVDLTVALEKNIVIHMVSDAGNNYHSAINMLVSKAVDVLPLVSKREPFDKVGKVIKEVAKDAKKEIAVIIDAEKI